MSNKSPREASRGYDCKPFVITLLCPLSFILYPCPPVSCFLILKSHISILISHYSILYPCPRQITPREASRGYDCKPFVITLLCPLSFILYPCPPVSCLLLPDSQISHLTSQYSVLTTQYFFL